MKTYSLAEALKSGKWFKDQKGTMPWMKYSNDGLGRTQWTSSEVCDRYVLKEEPREWDVYVRIDSDGVEHIDTDPIEEDKDEWEIIRVREILKDE